MIRFFQKILNEHSNSIPSIVDVAADSKLVMKHADDWRDKKAARGTTQNEVNTDEHKTVMYSVTRESSAYYDGDDVRAVDDSERSPRRKKRRIVSENTSLSFDERTSPQHRVKESKFKTPERSYRIKKQKKKARKRSADKFDDNIIERSYEVENKKTVESFTLSAGSKQHFPKKGRVKKKAHAQSPQRTSKKRKVGPSDNNLGKARKRLKGEEKQKAKTSLGHTNDDVSKSFVSSTINSYRALDDSIVNHNDDDDPNTKKKMILFSEEIHKTWSLDEERLSQLKAQGIVVRKGQWSHQEVKLLKSNMKGFLETHGLTDPMPLLQPSNLDVEEARQWKHFMRSNDCYRELGRGIQRELFLIYRQARRIFDPNNHAGRYTNEEVEELKRLHSVHGNNWSAIGLAMGRSSMSVNHKFYSMRASKGKWTDEEIERLNQAVQTVTNTDQPVFYNICWSAVATVVKSRTPEQCRRRWLEFTHWVPCSTERCSWTNSDDIALIKRLYNSQVTEECDVDWVEIAEGFSTIYSPHKIRNKWSLLRNKVSNYQEKGLEDLLDYLYTFYDIQGSKRSDLE